MRHLTMHNMTTVVTVVVASFYRFAAILNKNSIHSSCKHLAMVYSSMPWVELVDASIAIVPISLQTLQNLKPLLQRTTATSVSTCPYLFLRSGVRLPSLAPTPTPIPTYPLQTKGISED